MSNNALMARGSVDSWDVLVAQAQTLVKSKFLPAAIDSPEKAIAVMMTGQELGIPKMQALRQIVVINGKPTLSAELMLALIYRDHGDDAIRFAETTAAVCTVAYKRKSWKDSERFSFTLEDAKRAGLSGSVTWQKYPQALLRARCISAVARLAFPDTIGGMYTPEEMGAAVSVDAESGTMEVIDVTPGPAPQQALQQPQGDVVEGTAFEVRPAQQGTPQQPVVQASTVAPTLALAQKLSAINSYREQLGWSPTQLRELAASLHLPARSTEMTEAQADALLAELNKLQPVSA